MNTAEQQARKKPYRPPVLEFYGTVRDLTATLGVNGKNDMNGNLKTGL